jgi:hypothetical protein
MFINRQGSNTSKRQRLLRQISVGLQTALIISLWVAIGYVPAPVG